jgi:hypothetical protein
LHENFALQRDKSLRTVAFFRSLLGMTQAEPFTRLQPAPDTDDVCPRGAVGIEIADREFL